jgi:xylulose-5-phosphate/fructose-6-phosphate phosphoketolase
MDRWALAADALRMLDAERWATQIAEWELFRQEAFDFAVREGYDHPAFTDWVWPEVRGAGDGAAVNGGTGGDNDVEE